MIIFKIIIWIYNFFEIKRSGFVLLKMKKKTKIKLDEAHYMVGLSK